MKPILLALALLGCSRPEWHSGTLDPGPGIDANALTEAAEWWNANAGYDWRVGPCDGSDRCVPVGCGTYGDGCARDAAACVYWRDVPFSERPEIIVICGGFDDMLEGDMALAMAHEIGHIAGHEHKSGTVMGTPLDEADWTLP